MEKNLKICLAASAGGHLTQLLKLAQSWEGYNVFFVTTGHAVANELQKRGKVYIVGECNRRQLLKTIKVFLKCIKIMLKERPNVMLSTGAAVGCMLCFLGKLRGAKVIWVDSIANVRRLSMSGQIIRPFADLFLTQWPELADKGKRICYVGELI
jgi:UDP-N-acetylglucosamine:LPS N-acetylglucosamine transferase